MQEQFARTELLLGHEAMDKLANARVAVFGVGGVGGHVVEALARSGVGSIDIVDDDKVCVSNINRQIIATWSTVGQYKVDAMKNRIMDINPKCNVRAHRCFYLPETKDEFDFTEYDYVVDAVDTVTAKLQLVMQAKEAGVPIISSMGAGNKMNPAMFEVADIYATSVCPLAKVMRRELKKRGVKELKVVYSKEEAIKPIQINDEAHSLKPNEINDDVKSDVNGVEVQSMDNNPGHAKRATPGSNAFVPSVAGLIIVSEVIKDLCNK